MALRDRANVGAEALSDDIEMATGFLEEATGFHRGAPHQVLHQDTDLIEPAGRHFVG